MLLNDMSKFEKASIIFCAEYLVVAQALVFLVVGLQAPSLPEKIGTLVSGIILLLVSLLVTKIIKRIVHKRRPPKRIEYFIPFDRYAFPSAHSTTLFSITAFILSQNLWIGIISCIVSLTIVIARVKSNVHDFSDILGGFAVGISVTFYCMPYVTSFVYSSLVPALL